MIFSKNIIRDLDKTAVIIAIVICMIGCLAIFSATQAKGLPFSKGFVMRQISWIWLGLALFVVFFSIPYQRFIDAAYPIYIVNVVLLLLVLVIGEERLGAQRWFSIGAFTFQPSEFIKLSLTLALASYIGSRKEEMRRPAGLFIPSVLLAIPFALVLLQPDLGTALLLVPIFFALLFVGGVRPRYLALFAFIGLVSLPFFWHALRDYQRQRLLVFINPNIDPLGAGYTIIQSKIAIGSGGIFGKGWLAGTQNQLNFLPERHTDFIFSVIGEEWGFFGCAALVLLYLLLVKRITAIAASTSDRYGRLIATGVFVTLALQAVINIGMTIGLMPVVGIPLPLVSYGGSSVLANFIALGLALNAGARRSRF